MVKSATEIFRDARDFLLATREDPEAASRFRWPELSRFNWALDWFDVIAEHNSGTALWVVEPGDKERRVSFEELSRRSNQVANWFHSLGLRRGDRIVVMLGNRVELWETFLAATKLGAVIIPTSTLLRPSDVEDRLRRGEARHIVTEAENAASLTGLGREFQKVVVGGQVEGWQDFSESEAADRDFTPDAPTSSEDPLFLYFTSGTTAKPKLVEHTHASYPVGHLSTMYWIGLLKGDIHLNISSPGWAKHAWSSLFAPWNAEATVLVHNYSRFKAIELLDQMQRCGVTTFCAPPTVWRMLVQEDLERWSIPLRELVAAGEPLNAEVISKVRRAWGRTIRDGYGQTETTAQIGNAPGSAVKLGSMGRPLPGYSVALLEPISGTEADEGEICLDLSARPAGLMAGYRKGGGDPGEAMRSGYYHTGDVARRDPDGYITYIGRTDDIFKSSDYRISPFELESVLIEHEAVAEAAVVPSPDPLRLSVPKAFIALAPGHLPLPEVAESILGYARRQLAPYKRVRRLEFADLPKTISGKIRRVELRSTEAARAAAGEGRTRAENEFWEEDFPGLRNS